MKALVGSKGALPRAGLAALALFASLPGFAAGQPTPLDLLKRWIEHPGSNMTLIQSKRSTDSRYGMVQLKLVMDSKGRTRQTIIQPLSAQGIVSIDDGSKWYTVYPDRKEITIQESPLHDAFKADPRSDLIDKNYKLTYEKSIVIAQRKAVVILATPQHRELQTRRYYLDSETNIELRAEIITEHAPPQLMLDTIAAQVHKKTDESQFAPPDKTGFSVRTFESPRSFKEPSQATAIVGFVPRLPDNVPYGFKIYRTDIIGEGGRAFVAVRLSDGLTVVNVYEYDARQRHPATRRPADATDKNGIEYVVLTDIPRGPKMEILNRFIKEGGGPPEPQAIAPTLELVSCAATSVAHQNSLVGDKKTK